MTPMIDVTFLLLIFFLCTIRFKTIEGRLAAYLPRDRGPRHELAVDLDEALEVSIEVLAEGTRLAPDGAPWSAGGRFVYGADRRLRWHLGPRTTTDLEQLRGWLRDARSSLRERKAEVPRVILDAGPDAVYADVVRVLDMLREERFRRVTFAGYRGP